MPEPTAGRPDDATARRSRLRTILVWAARLGLLAAMVGALVYLVRRIGLHQLLATFRASDPWWVLGAVAAKATATVIAGLRFRRLALPFTTLSRRRAFNIVAGSYATNHLFGAGFATAFRVYGLSRAGASAGAGVSAVGLEKYLELLTFVLVIMPLALLLGAPAPLRWTFWIWVGGAVGAGGVAVIGYLVARHGRTGRLARMAAGLAALHRGGHLAASLGLTFLLMVFELAVLFCAGRAVGAPAGADGTLFAFLGAQFALMVPGPPSSIGAVEAGVVVTLEAVGVAPGIALAAALLYHAVHVVVEIPAGAPGLREAAWRPWRAARRTARASRDEAAAPPGSSPEAGAAGALAGTDGRPDDVTPRDGR